MTPGSFAPASVAALALAGLRQPRKSLPPKLFYDEEGCRLFYRITELPEYYLTRTERAVLTDVAPPVLRQQPEPSVLVEYGASDETKALHLLLPAAAERPPAAGLRPDRCRRARHWRRCEPACDTRLPWLAVHPVVADFMQPITLPDAVADLVRLGFFPGSTIGNLDPDAAAGLLPRSARATLGPRSRFLVGADLRKDPAVLLPAYDDAAGVTAAFNRNLLVRLNREAGGGFRRQPLRAPRRLERRGEPHRDAPGQPLRPGGAGRRPADPLRRGRDASTRRTATSTRRKPSPAWRRPPAGSCRQMWTDPSQWFALYLLAPASAA